MQCQLYIDPNHGYQLLLCVVGSSPPHDIYLANQNTAPNDHGKGNNGQVDPCKLAIANVDMLLDEDVAPEQAGQGAAEGKAEGTVVDAERHAVYCRPERPVADRDAVLLVNGLPCLDDPTE